MQRSSVSSACINITRHLRSKLQVLAYNTLSPERPLRNLNRSQSVGRYQETASSWPVRASVSCCSSHRRIPTYFCPIAAYTLRPACFALIFSCLTFLSTADSFTQLPHHATPRHDSSPTDTTPRPTSCLLTRSPDPYLALPRPRSPVFTDSALQHP